MVDKVALVCIPFLFATFFAYVVVFFRQFSFLDNDTNRLNIIAMRLALFLPLYAILMYISLLIPVIYIAMEVPLAIIEGYSFYAFFVLMVINLGGPNEAVNFLTQSNKKLLFYCCCPADKKVFFKNACWNVWYFMTVRVGVVLLSSICGYAHTKIAKVLSLVFSFVALLQLIYGVSSVVNLSFNVFTITFFLADEDVYAYTTNLSGVLKVLLLKMSVGLITIQGIIVELMVAFHANPYEENSEYSAEDRLQRNYCALVLIEFTAMAFVFFYAYGVRITAPNTPYNQYIASHNNVQRKDAPTMGWYLCEVLRFSDVLKLLDLEEDQKILSLGEPLLTEEPQTCYDTIDKSSSA